MNFFLLGKKILSLERKTQEVSESVVEMRNKMLDAKTHATGSAFNIKKSQGGVIDIEFIVQYLVLSHSKNHPELTEHTDNIRILDACAITGLMSVSIAQELKEIYLKYRKYLHQLSLQLLPETIDEEVFSNERDRVQKIWASLLHSAAA